MFKTIGLMAGILLAAPAAALTTITFDDIATGGLNGQYTSQGVSFQGWAVSDSTLGGALQYDSGTQYARPYGTSRISFPDPSNPMLNTTVNYISFDNLGLTAGTAYYNGFTVNAYSAPATPFGSGTLLASVTVSPVGPDVGRAQFTTTIAANGISYLLFSPIQNAAGAGIMPIDNFSFGDAPLAPVPEPGEWAMMAAGLGLVGTVARRKRRRA